jgi:uncharacterized membrane protein YphA (DoxX/SURF4 family)
MSAVLVREDVRTGNVPAESPLARAEAALKVALQRWSIPALRVSLGLIFLVFGALKYFPGRSPVQDLVERTFGKFTFGMVGGTAAMVITATVEVTAGLLLLMGGRFTRPGLLVFAAAEVGILSPIVLLPHYVFGPTGPTLTGQYIFKNLVLIAGALVVASRALHGPDARD